MSGVKIDGVWRQPAITSVNVAGTWKTVSTIFAKIDGVWRTTTFAGPPPAPTLSYTAEGQFTITNYDANLVYAVSGATRTGNLLTSVSNGATITTAYAVGATTSNVSTMNVLANARVLTTSIGVTNTGCGPRPDICCPDGRILNTSGQVCGGSPGSLAPDSFCDVGFGAPCPGNCYQLTVTCYNWYWTDYSGSGYTLIGQIWGRATNG
jgi:hypothetical protein